MLFAKCDNCGAVEDARHFTESVNKQQFCEPKTWLRRFDNKGNVIATLCCYNCDKAYGKGGVFSKGQLT